MAFDQLLAQTYFDNTLFMYLQFFGAIFAGFVLGKVFTFFNLKVLRKVTAKTKFRFDDLVLDLAERPIIIYISVAAAYVGFNILSFPNFAEIPLYAGHVFYLVLVLNTAWLFSRTIKAVIKEYITPLASKSKTDLDDTLIPILSKMTGFIVYALAVIMILDHFGQEIGPMLAGLGIGGLAFALAAKDLLANIFGSITVIMDKPFKRGDWIKMDNVDGIVDEINIRTTKVKSWDNTMFYVPNAKFTDSVLENVSQPMERKIKMNIGVTYDTSNAKMEKAVEILNHIVQTTKGVDKKNPLVAFTEFGDSALNILFIYYIIDIKNTFAIRHEVNMKIKKEFEKARIGMAFPTRTIELVKK